MLSGVRVILTAYTASFRVPSFVGYQLTLPVPPLSTIYGLLSASAGRQVEPQEVAWLAYQCLYDAKATDLEAIVTVDRSKPGDSVRITGRNILQREFLASPRLVLYLPEEWEDAFRRPRYSLLLGRTQDVAGIEDLAPAILTPVEAGVVQGVLLPLEVVTQNSAPAWLHNLPIAFSTEPRRRLRGMHIFGVLDAQRGPVRITAPGWLVRDGAQNTVLPLFRRDWILGQLT